MSDFLLANLPYGETNDVSTSQLWEEDTSFAVDVFSQSLDPPSAMSCSGVTGNEIHAFRHHDDEEIQRLNSKHQLVQSMCNGHLVHPAIPFSKITNIADVATGTGIWLEQLQADELPTSEQTRRFDGFDISDAQFPKHSKCTYAIQDVLKPFPPQYHDVYDLVHVRLLFLALKREQFGLAVKNLFKIIKPGGYLQWDDIDYEEIRGFPFGPVHGGIIFQTSKFFTGIGMSVFCSSELEAEFKVAGFRWTVKESRNSYWERELAQLTQKWSRALLGAALPRSLNWEGKAKDMEAAKKIAKPMLEALDREYMGGVVPNCALRVIIAQKSL